MDSQKTETEQTNTTAIAPDAPDRALQDVAMPIKAEAGQNAVVEAPQEETEPAPSVPPEKPVAVASKKPAKAPRSASSLPVAGIVVATLVLLALVGLAYLAYTKKG